MSIATEIARLQAAKADIADEIENKGVTVPSATKLDGYAALIAAIPSGGGGSIEHTSGHTDAFADDYTSAVKFAIAHGLSKAPKLFFMWTGSSDSSVRQWVGEFYAEDMLMKVGSSATKAGITFFVNANAANYQTNSVTRGTELTPDATNIYTYDTSTNNRIPAGSVIYWEAFTW